MKLPRSKPFYTVDIDIESVSNTGGTKTLRLALVGGIAARLNKQEVEDLITMLQYYKLQVWPEGKEN